MFYVQTNASEIVNIGITQKVNPTTNTTTTSHHSLMSFSPLFDTLAASTSAFPTTAAHTWKWGAVTNGIMTTIIRKTAAICPGKVVSLSCCAEIITGRIWLTSSGVNFSVLFRISQNKRHILDGFWTCQDKRTRETDTPNDGEVAPKFDTTWAEQVRLGWKKKSSLVISLSLSSFQRKF